MQVIVSLDGLSEDMLGVLSDCLPQSSPFLSRLSTCSTDSVFTTPQPIWAELLTKTLWYKNGCASYARPSGSLSKLEVFSESDLLTPADLILPSTVSINLPIIKPKGNERLWFSDGSLPINKVVAPAPMREQLPFSNYAARPYTSMVTTGGTTEALVARCIEVEKTRLECALAVVQNGFSRMFYRLTLFDQLTHLLGTNFLRCKDLAVYPLIARFLSLLDDALVRLLAAAKGNFFLFSAFSHDICQGTINLNRVLATGGFFSADKHIASVDNIRIAATSAVYKFLPVNSQTSAFDSQIGSQTVAYSPTSGCVYINRSGIFSGGTVERQAFEQVRLAVGNFLSNQFKARFGSSFTIVENPVSKFEDSLIPDFVLKIEGIEFNNVKDYAPVPRTTHSSKGFILGPNLPTAVSHLSATTIGACIADAFKL